MKGTLLRFYVHENRKHHHILLYEWLLERARKMGIHGGSAFRAIAGFGRHGVLPVARCDVRVSIGHDEAEAMLDLIRRENISIFYVRIPIEFGAIEGKH